MLTAKQKVFCEEYQVDMNATQAAIRAGYSERSAYSQGQRLLKNADALAYIGQLQSERSQRTQLTADYVLSGLREVAERCLVAKPVMEWDYANKELVHKRDEEGKGVYEFDSAGANRAFELMGKHLGIFEKDNGQKNPKSSVKVIVGKKDT